ncbi:membrane progesterone receptor epsilon [Latimeria chalumnae]|uniref:membrane progesterone receptor epsilon n=1 Tax=Latimeria chalumnae TaxID=7897 RepID=UPI0003C17BFC|nr:PREDICTED: progestin and adipoQ receptor family member 9 [Latimeria chalumnae]|eukprot:XP_005997958.1 PREDICTED: progestin and adipoQ receptor family member 9 [Latimeria chalumnae]
MLLKRKKSVLLLYNQVPVRVTESFILSGYRFPDYSFAECLLSAFQPTNETGNFWTHFLAVFVFAFSFLEVFLWDRSLALTDPFYYPFWSYFIGVCGLLLVSSMAHLLNSMSLLIRELCFFIDYGTISSYTVGSSLAYFYYINPRGGSPGNSSSSWLADTHFGPGVVLEESKVGPGLRPPAWPLPLTFAQVRWLFEALYVPAACVIALVCTLACCNTRQQWRRHRYVIRTAVFLLPFLVVSVPIFYQLYVGVKNSSTALFFFRHCFWLVVSGAFNISKIPERFSPGKFDIWGHSHQWFHFCTFMSILDELHMIKAEIKGLEGGLHLAPTALSTFGVMFLLQCSIAAIISWFGVRASMNERKIKSE